MSSPNQEHDFTFTFIEVFPTRWRCLSSSVLLYCPHLAKRGTALVVEMASVLNHLSAITVFDESCQLNLPVFVEGVEWFGVLSHTTQLLFSLECTFTSLTCALSGELLSSVTLMPPFSFHFLFP